MLCCSWASDIGNDRDGMAAVDLDLFDEGIQLGLPACYTGDAGTGGSKGFADGSADADRGSSYPERGEGKLARVSVCV